jgi:tetratricopeptide (TPR) repeat protein
MNFIADQFASWLFGLLADASFKQLTALVFGSDQKRALRRAAVAAIELTAREFYPESDEHAAALAGIMNHAFGNPIPEGSTTGHSSLLQAIELGISQQLTLLDEAELAELGSSLELLTQVSANSLSARLADHFIQQIFVRGARGGPLAPLADQLNHEMTRRQGQRIEDMVGSMGREILYAIARVENTPRMTVTATAAVHTLPADAASFIGRQEELTRLIDAVQDQEEAGEEVRVITIDGMAGVGKTVFAVHAAHKIAPHFHGGLFFVDLHGHTPGQQPFEPVDVLAALLLEDEVAPQNIPTGFDERASLWRKRMAGRRILLLLDDVISSEQIKPVLQVASQSLVLVIGRRRLTALPGALPLSLHVLKPDDAARLFVHLTGRQNLSPDDHAVIEIVRFCGYLPLAISLAAGRLKHHNTWAVSHLAADLEMAADRLSVMTAENVSVAAAFGLGYRDLPDSLKQFFRQLGQHPGMDIDVYAAAALNDSNPEDAQRYLDILFDHHLIDEPARVRYRFHDLVREYARTLAASDLPANREAAAGRLLNYYQRTSYIIDRYLARRTSAFTPVPSVIGVAYAPNVSSYQDAVAWMETERLNLQAAVEFAVEHTLWQYAIAIMVFMHGFIYSQGHWDQASALYSKTLEAARSADNPLAEAGMLTDLGAIQRLAGDYEGASAALIRALELYRELGSEQGEANALIYLGAVQYLTGDQAEASTGLTRALQLCRALHDPLGEANALTNLSIVQRATGDLQGAATSLSCAVDIYRSLDDELGEANAVNNLGGVKYLLGDFAEAGACHTQALATYRDIGYRFGEANALNNFGAVQLVLGKYSDSSESMRQALDIVTR